MIAPTEAESRGRYNLTDVELLDVCGPPEEPHRESSVLLWSTVDAAADLLLLAMHFPLASRDEGFHTLARRWGAGTEAVALAAAVDAVLELGSPVPSTTTYRRAA